MRKISLFAALVVAMGAVSCVQDINDGTPVNNDGAKTFEATFDAAASKAVLKPGADESKVEWEAGDQVSVLAGEGNYLYTAASAGASTTLNTEATDVPAEGTFYAVYPYDNAAALADGKISTTLPAEQTAVLGSFSTHLAVAQTTGSTLAFKNVCGLVKVTVSDAEVTKVEFKGNTDEIVAGGVSVTVTDTPAWTATETGSQVVTLVPAGEAATLAKGVYYLAVLPQTFEGGITVTAYKGDEAWDVRKVETPVTVARSDIKGSNTFGVEGSGTEDDPYILDAAQDLVEMRNLATLGGETWFKMVKDIDMEGITDYIPVNYDQNFERKIHFDGGNFTISNFLCDRDVYGGNYPSLFGVLYGSCKNLKVDKATIVSTNPCGVIGGYVGTGGKPGLVENVTITNASVTNQGERAGGVCGDAKEATFKQVSFQGSVTCTYTAAEAKSGGFVGQTESTAEFDNCSADVTVTGSSNDIGGFAGKTTGTPTFTDCSVKVTLVSKAPEKNRAGGFIGWNASTKTIITDCHVLAGSTVTDQSGRTAQSNGNYGGFIGFGDTAGTVLEITGSSANVVVNSGTFAVEASTFIGSFAYASTTTISGCSVSGELITSRNYAGGLIGCMRNSSVVTITGSNFSGIVKGASGVGGLVGGVESSTLNISKSYATGTVNNTNNNSGGLVGLSNGTTSIENSWANVNLISAGQHGGAIIGIGQGAKILVKNCYSLGEVNVSRGSAGIAGQTKATSTEISGCISWVSKIATNRAIGNWSPGAIVGCANGNGKFADCIRRSDMVLDDDWMTLVDQDNITSGTPPLPDYSSETTQAAYHGKAAAADATVTTVARDVLGWSSDIWDFSKDVPTLK